MTAAPDPLLLELTGLLDEMFDTPHAALDAGATLRGTLNLDSLDIADFAAAVNRRIGVRAPPSTYDSLRSLGAIRDFLVSHRCGQAPVAPTAGDPRPRRRTARHADARARTAASTTADVVTRYAPDYT